MKLKVSFNSTFRYKDDVLSLNNSKLVTMLNVSIQLDTTETFKCSSYLDSHFKNYI